MHQRSAILQQSRRVASATEILSSKELLYVESRMAGSPPVVAARMAGYEDPDAKAPDLESDARIRQALEELIRFQTAERKLTRDDVLSGFLDATRMAQTATELTGAWREIGRVIGAYEPQKLDVNVNSMDRLKESSDEELLELAALEGEYKVLSFDDD